MVLSPTFEAFSVSHAQILASGQTFLDALAIAALANEDIYGVNEASLEPDMDSYDNEGDDVILSTWDWLNKADLTVQAGYLSFPLIAELTGRPVDTLAAVVAGSEVQTISSNGATAGTFKLTVLGEQTAAIAWNANAAAITAAVEALSSVGAGNVVAAGGPLNTTAVTLTFAGALANRPIAAAVFDGTSLTGGTGSTVTRTTPGKAASKGGFATDLWHEDSMSPSPKPVIIKMPSKDKAGNRADFVIGLYKVGFKPLQFDGPAYKDGLKINYDGTALFSDVDENGVAFPDGKKRVGRLLAIEK